MQCVMVGRMELPLNLFPFYVLLLLLSLSQGRPPQSGGKNHSHHHSLAEGEQVGRSSRSTSSSSRNLPWEESSLVEEGGDVVVDDGDDGGDQLLYRNNILRELGLESAYIPTIQKPIMNISKEEYVAAYKLYMTNVRRRKEEAWKDVGPKRRRKNAVTKTRIFYDEGITDGEDNTTTFHFDINSHKFQESGKIIRIKRAELELPEGCRPLLNATRLLGGDDKSYDVSSAVTSWLFSAKNKINPSRPFTVSCSPLYSSSSNPGRLRLVTSELSKNRTRRSALPSTLQAFKLNKPRGGVDCTKTRRGKTCCRRSLKIKFSDLGISEVIIEPAEFDAHVCVGRCNAKRVSYSSTHAMFQHILHQTKGKGFVPRPCCAPTKLAELDVIHINSVNPSKPKLEVTVLKDAIVSECGCS